MGKLIHIQVKFYATCPECGGQDWLLEVNGPADQWGSIIATECKHCDFCVEWVGADKEE